MRIFLRVAALSYGLILCCKCFSHEHYDSGCFSPQVCFFWKRIITKFPSTILTISNEKGEKRKNLFIYSIWFEVIEEEKYLLEK